MVFSGSFVFEVFQFPLSRLPPLHVQLLQYFPCAWGKRVLPLYAVVFLAGIFALQQALTSCKTPLLGSRVVFLAVAPGTARGMEVCERQSTKPNITCKSDLI